jgi:hypothetical protein
MKTGLLQKEAINEKKQLTKSIKKSSAEISFLLNRKNL